MPRRAFSLSSLVLLVACAGNRVPAPTVANAKPATRYVLQPVQLHDGMGRHSSFQSWTTLSGSLAITGTHASLALVRRSDTSPVHCPDGYQGMQACAPRDAKPSTRTSMHTLTGDARWDAGALHLQLRDGNVQLSLACRDSAGGYTCSVASQQGLTSPMGGDPSELVFAASS